MVYLLLFILFVVLSYFESVVLSLSLSLVIILTYYLFLSEVYLCILVAFFLGLVYDLININSIGASSLLYLIILLIFKLYQKKFITAHVIFRFFFSLISFIVVDFFRAESFSLLRISLLSLLAIIFFFFIEKLFFSKRFGYSQHKLLMNRVTRI